MNPNTPNQQSPHANSAGTPGPSAAMPYPNSGAQPYTPAPQGYQQQYAPQQTAQPYGQPQMPGYDMPGVAGNVQTPVQPPAKLATPKTNPNSTQNLLQIAEIRDGLVIMNDGSFRAVVMVKSVNFDLMSPQEREGVEYGYQGFLNSLYFPIQIFIRSQKVDLRPYIERLDKIRVEHDNMLLALMMEDYIGFMSELATQTNIMDKKFYVVIPYYPSVDAQRAIVSSKKFLGGLFGAAKTKEVQVTINEPDLEAAKTELRNRVQAVLAGLQQCGIQGLPLDTQELIELYYDAYNPDTATRQQLKNFDDIAVPVVTKGQGEAPQPQLDKELR